jgi:hypothetical protein
MATSRKETREKISIVLCSELNDVVVVKRLKIAVQKLRERAPKLHDKTKKVSY